jgi:uncharacterized protein
MAPGDALMTTARLSLCVAALLVSACRVAQRPPPPLVDEYVALRGVDTIATERVARTADRVESHLIRRFERLDLRIGMARAADERVASLAMEAKFIGADTVLQRAWLRFAADTAILDVALGSAAARPLRFSTSGDALPFIKLAIPTYEQIVRRARALGLSTERPVQLQVFLLEGARTLPATVRHLGGDSVSITLGAEMRLAVDRDGRLIGAHVPAQGLCVVRLPSTTSCAPPRSTTDYSAPSDAPYVAESVTLRGSGGAVLAGTLTLPRARSSGRMSAVLLLSGSGPQDRDEAIPSVPGYRPFRQIADALGRRGIAVLRLDDRGVGGSAVGTEGNGLDVLTRDATAAVAWLRTRAEIDPARVAIVGHSEGGMIAPIVASSDSMLRTIVLIAAPARTGRVVTDYQIAQAVEQDRSISAAARDSAVRAGMATRDALARSQPAIAAFLDHDPRPVLRRVRAPVLVLHGETDRQVTADQAGELEALLRDGGNRDVTIQVIPNTNHLLLADPVGHVAGYGALPEKAIRAEIVRVLADWLGARLR